jgi:alanine racemase
MPSPGRKKLRSEIRPPAPMFAYIEPVRVVAVEEGAATDGHDLVTVDWRGTAVVVNGYFQGYTPAVDDQVDLIIQGEKAIILGKIFGVM